jgi:hypothetical protein
MATTPARVVGGEDDSGRLDRHVGAGADGDADVGLGERRGVVDAVAHHRHPQALPSCSFGHLRVLVLREHLGEDLVDVELAATASATWRRPR